MTLSDASSVGRLYRAVVDNDAGRATALVTENVFVAVPGHEGSGRSHLGQLIARLHATPLRTWSKDSADVLTSEHHGVVLDRWLQTGGAGGDLDEHITLLAAAVDDDGRFGLVSIYGFNNPGIERFFGTG